MTADERNRRMKYGNDVPRWWIADFHVPAEPDTRPEWQGAADSTPTDANEIRELRILRRRKHQVQQREQSRRLNRDLRNLQKGIALLIVGVGFLGGGLLGLVIGACIGLAVIAWRFEP